MTGCLQLQLRSSGERLVPKLTWRGALQPQLASGSEELALQLQRIRVRL